MRNLPGSLRASLLSGVTTLARCWLLVRIDGVALGFTDHDRDLHFDGVTFEAMAGMTASAIQASGTLDIDTTDISGALQSDHLNDADLAAGLFDNAALTLFLVDWSNPDDRDILIAGSIGEVSRGNNQFVAEMRGLSHALNQPTGRLYARSCDADLGDARCGINLASSAYRGAGIVTAIDSNSAFAASGLEGFASGWFEKGKVTWTSGRNHGGLMEVKFHINDGALTSVALWETMPLNIAVGDHFEVVAGCDKSSDACAGKFGNLVNFRGFPFLTGNDILSAYPTASQPRTGDSMVGGGSKSV